MGFTPNYGEGATPGGAAGGDLAGTYPNPTVPGLLTRYNNRGTWATLTAYAVNDVVAYSGAQFACIVAVPSSNTTPPVVGATWAAFGGGGGSSGTSIPTTPSANQEAFANTFTAEEKVYSLAPSDMGKVLTNLTGNKNGEIDVPSDWATSGGGQVLVLNHGRDLVLRCEAGEVIGYDTLRQVSGGAYYGSGPDSGNSTTQYTSIATLIPANAASLLTFDATDGSISNVVTRGEAPALLVPVILSGYGYILDCFSMLGSIALSNVPASNFAFYTNSGPVEDFSGLKVLRVTTGGGAAVINTGAADVRLDDLEEVVVVNTGGNLTSFIQVSNTTNLSFKSLKRAVQIDPAGNQTSLDFSFSTYGFPFFPQAVVDAILVKLASMDGTLGTTMWNGSTTLLASCQAPSAVGYAAKAAIIARGGNVQTY